MYRPSNQNYNDQGMKSYPYNPSQHQVLAKNYENYPNPVGPVYYQQNNNNNYDYPMGPPLGLPPSHNTDNYQRNYVNNWHKTSQPKSHGNIGPSSSSHHHHNNSGGYDHRKMAHNDFGHKNSGQTFGGNVQGNPLSARDGPLLGVTMGMGGVMGPTAPQLNIVQRISGLIKSQLGSLQSIQAYGDKKTKQQFLKKRDRSRSRSREYQRRVAPRREHREWNCPKCNFLNFDFRDQCKRCNENKPADRENFQSISKPYVPGPDDWRCNKCNSSNYPRRTECYRCHFPRNK